MSLSPLAFALIALSGCVGYVLGTHSELRLDLGDPVKQWKERRARLAREREITRQWPVILPRRPLLAFLALLTVVMVGVSVLASVSTFRANDAEDQAKVAAENAIETTDELSAFTRCYARYQQAFIEGYTQRLAASNEVGQALEDVLAVVLSTDPDEVRQAEFVRVAQDYLNARDAQSRTVMENPVPPTPTKVCGSVGGEGR